MYKALYREYRPQTFSEVLGQEHITRTLKNQLRSGNIGHAYLFCGERGTGKTSTAKIFARAVNCLHLEDGDPCNQCDACRVSMSEESMDIVEMDAASNRTIANIRGLKEMINYPPTHLKRKVYIIDEVHMLTTEAFNALLKTLEEPPSYVIFILATTEPEKLPETILSRCQRFDFRRVSELSLQQNIQRILADLGRTIEDAALRLIISNAEGSVRDSLSLLDRLVGYSESVIRYKDALEILGAVDQTRLLQLAERFFSGDLKSVLITVSELSDAGKDIAQLLRDFIREIRNLMLVKVVGKPAKDILYLGETEYDEYSRVASRASFPAMERTLSVLLERENVIRWSTQPRILFEASLISLVPRGERGMTETIPIVETEVACEPASESIVVEGTVCEQAPESMESALKTESFESEEAEESSGGEELSETESSKEETVNPPPLDLSMILREWKNACNDLAGLTKLVAVKLKPWRWERGILSVDPESLDGFEVSSVSSEGKLRELGEVLREYFGADMEIHICKERGKEQTDASPKKTKKQKPSDAEKINEFFADYWKK